MDCLNVTEIATPSVLLSLPASSVKQATADSLYNTILGGLRVVLGGVDRDALSLRDAGGVDHDFVVCGAGVGLGLGGCAQRLEGASALAVVCP